MEDNSSDALFEVVGGSMEPLTNEERRRLKIESDALNEKAREAAAKVRVIVIDQQQRSGICVGGRLDGWLMRKHPDGQWVSIRKLDEEQIVSDE